MELTQEHPHTDVESIYGETYSQRRPITRRALDDRIASTVTRPKRDRALIGGAEVSSNKSLAYQSLKERGAPWGTLSPLPNTIGISYQRFKLYLIGSEDGRNKQKGAPGCPSTYNSPSCAYF
jgi:hypothetical protein